MDCYLKKHIGEEHDIMNTKYGSIFFTCPIFDKQICFWCCLHIHDVADPQTRNTAIESHPAYGTSVPELAERDLDSMWETCVRCKNT